MIILSKSLHDYLKAAAIKDGKRVLLFPQIRHSQRTKKHRKSVLFCASIKRFSKSNVSFDIYRIREQYEILFARYRHRDYIKNLIFSKGNH